MPYSKADRRLTKETEANLLEIASQLPGMEIHSQEKHFYTGAEILEWDTITEVDGKPIDPEETYQFNHPVIIRANHYRRLRRAWKKNSIAGVINYCERINKLKIANEKTA